MPTYKANTDIWLSHESRIIRAGDTFSTVFPKVKNHKGELVEMRLGSNIESLDDQPVIDSEDAEQIEEIRKIYEEMFGETPHKNTSVKTLKEKIEARRKELGGE